MAEELLSYWKGIEGWHDHQDPSDQSDYARACRISGCWLGLVPCHSAVALVLSGDVGPVAWVPDAHGRGGLLVQCIATNDEASIDAALRSEALMTALEAPNAEQIEFSTGPSGLLRLFDSAEPGNQLRGDNAILTLLPGSYLVRATCVENSSLILVVRELAPILR